jgi:diacylglycerol O-acyltransferase / wax synthase
MERLTDADQIMLWPDQVWPQDIGAIAVLEGSTLLDPDGRFRIEVVREAIAGRLHLAPRFRQLLYVPPRKLGGPLWVDAPAFDLTDHVRVHHLPAPGDEAQLLLAVEQLRRRRLNRSRPLWEMWFLPGLSDGRVGMFVRTHHCMADGLAGVATLGTFLDVTAGAVTVPGPEWTPTPLPSVGALRADNLKRRKEDSARRLSMLTHPVSSALGVVAAWPTVREVVAEAGGPETSLNLKAGPDRTLAIIRSRLDPLKAVAHAHDAKVNDVLLTVIAAGLRHLLRSRGERVDGVSIPIYVPVTLRKVDRSHARGNQIGQMVVPLPIGVSDPFRRLELIAAETIKRKARSRPSVGKVPHRGLAARVVLRLIDRQRVNVESADLPGPPVPLYLAGARLLELFPLLPLIGKVSLGVGALSYAEEFNITAVADKDAYPDLEVFAAAVRDELRVLVASTAARPGRERIAEAV